MRWLKKIHLLFLFLSVLGCKSFSLQGEKNQDSKSRNWKVHEENAESKLAVCLRVEADGHWWSLLKRICNLLKKEEVSMQILRDLDRMPQKDFMLFHERFSFYSFDYMMFCLQSNDVDARYLVSLLFRKLVTSLSKKQYERVIFHFFVELHEDDNVFGNPKTYNEVRKRINIMFVIQSLLLERSVPFSWKKTFKDMMWQEYLQGSPVSRFRAVLKYFFPNVKK